MFLLLLRIIGDAAVSGRKAIASMSLGGSLSQTLNAAVNAASIAGVMVVVAAGNDSMDACGERRFVCIVFK